jgi:hypothetical protein
MESIQLKIEKSKKKLEGNKKTYEAIRSANIQMKKLICLGIPYKDKGIK